MEKTEIKIKKINGVNEEDINKVIDPNKTIIKVTQEVYYELYEVEDKDIEHQLDKWFCSGIIVHAYRDASKLPWVNLLKVEKLERK